VEAFDTADLANIPGRATRRGHSGRVGLRHAIVAFSVVLAADQVLKYVAADGATVVGWGEGRLAATSTALAAVAMLLLVVVGAATVGLVPHWLAGVLAGSGTSLVIDRMTVGAARQVFDLGGIADLATVALLAGAAAWIVTGLRACGEMPMTPD
jgi:hypothetical protein